MRVHDYGWTSDRIVAAARMAVAACYAGGYLWAARSQEAWTSAVAKVNVATAFVVLAVLFALFTPLADPARLSVNDQMARLAAGKVQADKFDFRYLRFEGHRYGQEALEQLARSGDKAVSDKAGSELKLGTRWGSGTPELIRFPNNVTMWPATARLPASFVAQKWDQLPFGQQPGCVRNPGQKCDAWLLDVDGDEKPEVLLFRPFYPTGTLYAQGKDGRWTQTAEVGPDRCGTSLHDMLKAGKFSVVTTQVKALELGGRQFMFKPSFSDDDCMVPHPH
ncbi:DUF4153 domain-containing protein [Massilia endophytica]|nr:DUF4153 domain-containing protein [Massilia endophytica]